MSSSSRSLYAGCLTCYHYLDVYCTLLYSVSRTLIITLKVVETSINSESWGVGCAVQAECNLSARQSCYHTVTFSLSAGGR